MTSRKWRALEVCVRHEWGGESAVRAMPGGFASTDGGGILGDAQLPPRAGGGGGDGINRGDVVADEWRREKVNRMERYGDDD